MALRHKLACLVALPVIGLGGWMVLRGSSLFAVDQVTIVGLSPNALPAVSDQLIAAARTQTTTDFSVAALRASVASYTLIDGVSAQTHFPHSVRIEVRERQPIARLAVARRSFPLAADGALISGLANTGSLPVVRSTHAPSNGRTGDAFALLALRVLSDAPALLRERAAAVTRADGALTIYLHRGPRLIFGNYALLHAKWDAAAAVLADPSSRGAVYIDLRVPSRPAAQVADPATSATTASATGAASATPASATTVSTALAPALIGPSSSTSG
jgi:cell division septal protein FtsQ